jgi:hypothetical protein
MAVTAAPHVANAGPARPPRPGARPRGGAPPSADLQPDPADGHRQAAALPHHGIPVFYPRLIATGTTYEGPTPAEYPRAYRIRDPHGTPFAAYRIVLAVNPGLGQYYGVEGMTWKDPPILADPSEVRIVDGKALELHFDGGKLRLVAWRTPRAVYWISNTLSLDLSNAQMLGIAGSLTRA